MGRKQNAFNKTSPEKQGAIIRTQWVICLGASFQFPVQRRHCSRFPEIGPDGSVSTIEMGADLQYWPSSPADG